MASTNDTLPLTTYFLSVYLGYFIVFIGVFGNLMNILVFTQLRLFRRNQSALYLTVASIADFAELIFPITTDITATAFNFDLTRTSALWCKFETYLAKSSRIISTMTICLAAVDQYLSTNYNSNLRRLSTYNSAQYLTRILFIFALAYSGLFLVFQNISPHLDCATFDSIFNYFYSFFHYCIFVGIFPIFISLLFSLLAYRNVRRIVRRQIPIIRRRLDHQLTAMILIRVAWFVITTLPYISFRIYQINNVNCYYSGCALADIELINSIFLRLYSLNYSVIQYLVSY